MAGNTLLNEDLKQLISKKCNSKVFVCKDCGRSFTQMDYLQQHLCGKSTENYCSKSKQLNKICEICKKRFLHSKSLEIHMYIHSGICLFTCTTCHKEFEKPRLLTKHMSTHLEKDFQCGVCDSWFQKEIEKDVHMRIHSGEKPYVCPDCPYKSTQKSNLKTHSRVHSGEKPAVCKECQKCFTTLSYLKIHMQSHMGLKLHSCNECEKLFKQKQHLETHMLIHREIKAFRCDHCNKPFRRSHHLKSHLLLSHSQKRPLLCKVCKKAVKTKEQ